MEKKIKNLKKNLKKGANRYVLFKHTLVVNHNNLDDVIRTFVCTLGSFNGTVESTFDDFVDCYSLTVSLSNNEWVNIKEALSEKYSLELNSKDNSIYLNIKA